jgi:hypothetical protein
MNKILKTLTSNKSDEHNTPSYIIEAAREVLGVINLDPMSNALANEVIRANTYYTKEDNGLEKEWKGNIWLNPPFSLADEAVDKLINSYEKGEVTSAILLLKSAIETKRYQKLYPYPFCELNKRVNFIPNRLNWALVFILILSLLSLKDNKLLLLVLLGYELQFSDSAPFATVLFYFGTEYYKWNKVMSKYGRVHPGNKLTTDIASCCDKLTLRLLGVIE